MADDNVEDTSHPYFVPGGFPFVFLPTTFTTGFTFANNHTHVSTSDNPTTTESKERKENDEEIEGEEGAETIDDDDDVDRTEKNDDNTNEKNDLRISQPKYRQLLKELDFSQTRMVDVTNLLSNEFDQQEDYSASDEDESPNKKSSNIKYETSSSTSSDEIPVHRTSNTNKAEKDEDFLNAANDIQNDLNNLAAIIQEASPNNGSNNPTGIIKEASQIPIDKNEEISEHLFNDINKKPTFDEDDDTSKQVTQNYDLPDNEQEDIIASSKSSRNSRVLNQHTNDIRDENKSSISNRNIQTKTQNQTKKQNEEHQLSFTWGNLVHGSDPIIESDTTPKKPPSPSQQQQQPLTASGEKSKQQKIQQRFHQVTSSSSSSSDTDSIVEHVLEQSKQEQSSLPPKQPTQPSKFPPQTLRQDSQGTLIDENLDELSSQIKQVLLEQDQQTLNTDIKEERTTNGLASMSFPLSTQYIPSTDILENNISNRTTNDLLRRLSNQKIDSNRYTSDIPERSHRKKTHHHYHHHQKHFTSRTDETNERKTDDNWLIMLEKLECEHLARLEKQQQQYEGYMHTLEAKMKRRFDDYLTLTNGFQESRLDNYNDTTYIPRTHTSIPIDSNIGRYKNHSYTHQYRPLAKDLISHYYPADSTLNILTTEKKRSTITDYIPQPQSREDIIDLRTELSAKHAKHIADLKLYYESEINELKSQLNRIKMGHTSSSTRQSIETIERINNENIRLRDEVDELRHSLKMTSEENILLKRQLEELREQLNTKDLDLKKYHRTISDLEQQLTEAENTKERQNEISRHGDRQASFYQEENERIKTDLNLTRERLVRLEERFREQENENESLRRQIFMLENDTNRLKNSTMTLNIPTAREYGRFTLTTTKPSSSPIISPKDGNINSGRYQSNTGNVFRHTYSPRPITRLTDYINETPIFPQPYISPSKYVYSPKKSTPNRRRVEPMSMRNSADKQTRQREQLEQKLDQLLKKQRDLENRIDRIPIRNLTTTDRQLYDVLQREIDRVEQQISNVKQELRKLNISRTH